MKSERKTTKQFIIDSKKKHGEKYDYSLVDYINASTKVSIICRKHGEFSQKPNNHLMGNGCPKCSKSKRAKSKTYTNSEYIALCRKTHGDRYVYDKTVYRRNNLPVTVTCKIHGDFEIAAIQHRQGGNCQECSKMGKPRTTVDDFIGKSVVVHGVKYDYGRCHQTYNGVRSKVDIECPEHGVFTQVAYYHLGGNGCPFCRTSIGEEEIRKWLIENNVRYEREVSMGCTNPKTGRPLRYDFFLPDFNLLVEYDGIQHFKPITFSDSISKEKSKENLRSQKERDRVKTHFAQNHGYGILRISYMKLKDVNKILRDFTGD